MIYKIWRSKVQLYINQSSQINGWLIDLDGGSATRSACTQVIKRMGELAQVIGVRIRLIYPLPYPSQYNPIERCWAVLEN
ncbi:MAG: hypothetical protein VKJ46_05215 [Leptolyngbyaceae bacterium]|nr:hypothetical protein [Leptolyngbyaceae bacterium]